ncbi:hypothetical protein L484_002228 [Morus notabilis]|uniref:Uncharacterized protein n=1 Tax=Morus notabilis TaxID=981085 RepID=W9S1P7_9ROSA|nr:hypothetical protein L484_002228 [Morus notabilis]
MGYDSRSSRVDENRDPLLSKARTLRWWKSLATSPSRRSSSTASARPKSTAYRLPRHGIQALIGAPQPEDQNLSAPILHPLSSPESQRYLPELLYEEWRDLGPKPNLKTTRIGFCFVFG